jgi:4a-hydroxytetrahydrobiopterin dehydratase
MTMKLADRVCVPCRGAVPPLKREGFQPMLDELGPGWEAVRDHHLEKEYKFKNFLEALAFTNAVGRIAEREGHHPEITLTWGKVILRIWTHKIDGLTESDFVLAAKAEQEFQQAEERRL